MFQRSSSRTNRAILAGLSIGLGAQTASAGISATFDLNADGAIEGWAESDYSARDFWGRATISDDIWNSDATSTYSFVWAGPGHASTVGKSPGAGLYGRWPTSFQTYLSIVEKRGNISWTSDATGAITAGRANYYDSVVSAVVYHVGDLVGLVKGGSGGRSLVDGLEFSSVLADGVITHRVTNRSSSPIAVGFDWSAVGLTGILGPGESMSRLRPALEGATERKSVFTHDMYVEGLGVIAVQSRTNYWQPVPAPATLTLTGLAALIGGRRRRR